MLFTKKNAIKLQVALALIAQLTQATAQTVATPAAGSYKYNASLSKPSKINRLALVSKSSTKCLQTNPLQTDVVLASCADKDLEQRFMFLLSDAGKTIVKDNAGRCMQLVKLEPNQNSEGDLAKVTFAVCTSSPEQEWAFNGDGVLRNYSNKCLDVLGGLTADGSKIGAYKCHGGANQIWTAR